MLEGSSTENGLLVWTTKVSLLANRHILRQVFWVVQISIIIVVLLAFLIQAFDPYARVDGDYLLFLGQLYLMLLGVFAVLTLLGVGVVMGNRYEYTFRISSEGIAEEPAKKQAKKNKIVNTLLVVLGLFSRNPGAAGAGMIAQSRQKNFVRWQEISHVEVDDRGRTLLLKRNKRTLMMVFATQENYSEIKKMVRSYLPHVQLLNEQ